jgi:hypothetical protein
MQENIDVKKSIGELRHNEQRILEWILTRLNYDTLGDLVKDLIAGKLAHVTEDQQIEIMKKLPKHTSYFQKEQSYRMLLLS